MTRIASLVALVAISVVLLVAVKFSDRTRLDLALLALKGWGALALFCMFVFWLDKTKVTLTRSIGSSTPGIFLVAMGFLMILEGGDSMVANWLILKGFLNDKITQAVQVFGVSIIPIGMTLAIAGRPLWLSLPWIMLTAIGITMFFEGDASSVRLAIENGLLTPEISKAIVVLGAILIPIGMFLAVAEAPVLVIMNGLRRRRWFLYCIFLFISLYCVNRAITDLRLQLHPNWHCCTEFGVIRGYLFSLAVFGPLFVPWLLFLKTPKSVFRYFLFYFLIGIILIASLIYLSLEDRYIALALLTSGIIISLIRWFSGIEPRFVSVLLCSIIICAVHIDFLQHPAFSMNEPSSVYTGTVTIRILGAPYKNYVSVGGEDYYALLELNALELVALFFAAIMLFERRPEHHRVWG
jgi:hypothetical protein